MLRVALVLDDYNELIYLQTILRKIGVDVEGLQNVKKYEELSLGFNPQVLITSAFGKKVNGLDFIKNLHRVRGFPKIIVLTTSDRPISKQETESSAADLFLSSPVNPKNLIIALAQVGNVDEQILLDKFEKLQATGFSPDETIQLVGQDIDTPVMGETPRFSFRESSTPQTAPSASTFKLKKEETTVIINDPERKKKYTEYVAKLEPLKDPNSTSYNRDKILQLNKKIRSAPQPEDIKEIEHDRKDFVRHLFTKK